MAFLYCDGASRGNPGPASAGFWAEENGNILFEEGILLGNTTNNVAEWKGVLLGLKKLAEYNVSTVDIFLDSELVVKQILGKYKVKNEKLIPLFGEVLKILKVFKTFTITHIRREKNKKADQLANAALDTATL